MKLKYERIIEIAKQNNIKVVIINEPVWLRKGKGILMSEEMLPVYKRYNDLFAKLDAFELDANRYFTIAPNKRELFLDDGLHLSKKGNEYMAKIIWESVKKIDVQLQHFGRK